METTNAMTVNENGNVDVESLKNSGNQKMKCWKTLVKS